MSTGFIPFALQQVRVSLAETTYDAGLTRSSDTVPQSAARWWQARAKALVIILRRLIMLMARNLTLDPPKPRCAKAAPTEEDTVHTRTRIPCASPRPSAGGMTAADPTPYPAFFAGRAEPRAGQTCWASRGSRHIASIGGAPGPTSNSFIRSNPWLR